MLIRIAWRNVWRNKTRSLVIIVAVALGLWGGIFSDAFMQGMSEQQINSSIHTETGHIQLNASGFLLNHDMQLSFEHSDSLLAIIRAYPEVKAASTMIQVTAMASTASSSSGVMVNGIDPDSQRQVSDLSTFITTGDYFVTDRKNSAVIGEKLAEKLRLKLHSRLVLTLQTFSGEIIYSAFRVVGIYRSHDSDFDKQMIYVQGKDLQKLLGFPPDAGSILTVLLHRNEDVQKITDLLARQFPSLQIQNWIQLSPMLQLLSSTMNVTTLIFVGIILVALAFGIINTMLMAVMDRTREIGMLRSIGMKPSKVFGMILLETIFLSITGAFAGVALSIVTIYWFGKKGINLSMIAEGVNAMGYSSIVYPTLGAGFYISLALMVILIALVSGIFPARRAIQLKPADAIRGE